MSDDSDTAVSQAACDQVDVADCGATTGCAALTAWRVQTGPDGPCADLSQPQTAMACVVEQGCNDTSMTAAPPEDPAQCWLFPSMCIPAGWVSCEAVVDASSLPYCP